MEQTALMANTATTVKQTIAKEARGLFKRTPDKEWTTNKYTDCKGACCALGHWGRAKKNNIGYRVEDLDMNAINNLSSVAMKFFNKQQQEGKIPKGLPLSIPAVNDKIVPGLYEEPTPKARILHLMNDMIEAGF